MHDAPPLPTNSRNHVHQALRAAAIAVLLAASASSKSLAADLSYRGFDLRAGVNQSSDWDRGETVGASIDLGELTGGLSLHPGLFYSRTSTEDTFFGVKASLDLEDVAVGAEVRYSLDRGSSGFYFGGGPYAHRVTSESAVSVFGASYGVVSVDSTRVGAMGVAGYRWQASRVALFAEARYNAVTDFDGAWILIGIAFGGAR